MTDEEGQAPHPNREPRGGGERGERLTGSATVTDEEGQAPHPTSVAVWGAPSPVIAASRFTVTVGVKCAAACPLAGQPVVIRDETGRDIGHGTLGAEPRAGTRALYAVAVTLTAPPEPGVHAWTAAFPGAGAAEPPADEPTPPPATGPVAPHREAASPPKREAPPAPHEVPSAPRHEAAAALRREAASTLRNAPVAAPLHGAASATRHHAASVPGHEAAAAPRHEAAACTFSFRAVEPPENAVTVTVVDRDTETPLADADVHLGVYRAPTDTEGRARVAAPAGEYDLYVRSPGYVPHTEPVTVTGDATLRVAAVRVSAADFDDDQVWM